MGYPTRRVKRRRHNRNLQLYATVALCGANIQRRVCLSSRGWDVAYYAIIGDDQTAWRLNPIAVLEQAAEMLGLDGYRRKNDHR